VNHGDSASNPTAADGDARDTRVGQILNEFLDRRARGEPVSETALLAQHPDLAGELRECLELVRDLQPPADRIDALIAQGVLSKPADPRYLAELGPYKITDFIGRGGMGVVLKAYEESLDRAVALKILRPELAGDGGALRRFEREARAAAALRHPNIVTVYAIGAERGSHYIAMEYVAGPSLADVIHNVAVGAPPAEQNRDRQGAVSDVAAGAPARPINLASGLRAGRTELRPSESGRKGEAPAEPDTGKDTADPSSRLRAGTAVPHIPLGATGGLPTSAGAGAPSLPGVGDGCGLPLGRESLLGPDMIRSIFRQLLSALAAAHEAGLIHRDVKSSNILLDRWSSEGPRGQGAEGPREETTERAENVTSGAPCHVVTLSPCHAAAGVPPACVKLADFGLARMVAAETRMTMPHAVLGTPEYMSPEQARGDESIDHRTDLYSAGVVLYEMLTGHTPFKADTPTATIHQMLHDDPPDPRKLDKTVDPALASLALRLMAKSPNDRFSSAAKAIEALEANKRVQPSAHRFRVHRRVLCGVCALALLIAGIWWLASPTARPVTAQPPITVPGEPTITKVMVAVDPDGGKTLRAKYGDKWKDFPAKVESPIAAQLLDQYGNGNSVVVVGLEKLAQGSNLVAFDVNGHRQWGYNLYDESKRQWPDCGPPADWKCTALAVADLDGDPGEEVVAATTDTLVYPTRVSVIDPRAQSTRATFWHMGEISGLAVQPDFFDERRPAIIAWGLNNKLDGFGDPPPHPYPDPPPGEDKPRTEYGLVAVVMILDPDAMDGLGPPRNVCAELQDIPAAPPHAYAFLNLPGSLAATYVPQAQTRHVGPSPEDVAQINTVELAPYDVDDDAGPWLMIRVTRLSFPGGALFIVNRFLEVRRVETISGGRVDRTTEDWRERWHPVIQRGEYVDEAP